MVAAAQNLRLQPVSINLSMIFLSMMGIVLSGLLMA
jgi:hypothetical protein